MFKKLYSKRVIIAFLVMVLSVMCLCSVCCSESVIDQFEFGMKFEEAKILAKELEMKGQIEYVSFYCTFDGVEKEDAFSFDLLNDEYGVSKSHRENIQLNFDNGVLVAITYSGVIGNANKNDKTGYDERSKILREMYGVPDYTSKNKESANLSSMSSMLFVITGDIKMTNSGVVSEVFPQRYEQWLVEGEDGTVRLLHHAEIIWKRSDYKEAAIPEYCIQEQVAIVNYK